MHTPNIQLLDFLHELLLCIKAFFIVWSAKEFGPLKVILTLQDMVVGGYLVDFFSFDQTQMNYIIWHYLEDP